MIKSKAVVGMVAVALAAFLPAPSAQASELVKLGKLIVTGKRQATTALEAKPAPAPERTSSPRPEGTGERGSSRIAVDVLGVAEPVSSSGATEGGSPDRSSSEPGSGRSQGPNSGEPGRGSERLSHATPAGGALWA